MIDPVMRSKVCWWQRDRDAVVKSDAWCSFGTAYQIVAGIFIVVYSSHLMTCMFSWSEGR